MAAKVELEEEDYYSVLGCHPSASEEQIMTEFRVRAKQSHPDKEGTTEEFQVLMLNIQRIFFKFCGF